MQFAFVFNPNRCIGCQTCTMACKSTWTFSKGQELMWWNNVESKPYGGYPQNWDSKLLNMLEEANPGNQVWDARAEPEKKPYGNVRSGMTIFEAAQKTARPRRARKRPWATLPTDDEWRAPQHSRRHPDRGAVHKDGQFGGSANCPSTRCGSFTWRASAITAPIRAAWHRVRGTRSTNGPKTASC